MTIATLRQAHGHVASDIDPSTVLSALRALGLTVAPVAKTSPAGDRDYLKRLGEVIVEIRVLRGISQARLADAAHKSTAAVSRWENGKAAPDATDLRSIRKAIGMPALWFFEPPAEQVTPDALDLACVGEGGLMDGLLEAGSPNLLRPASRRLRPSPRRPASSGQPG